MSNRQLESHLNRLKENADKEKELEKLRSQNERYRAALESVADLSQQDSIKEIYWRLVSHGNCAEVLAEDVKICREALKEVDNKEF